MEEFFLGKDLHKELFNALEIEKKSYVSDFIPYCICSSL